MHYSKIPISSKNMYEEVRQKALESGLGVWGFVHTEVGGKKLDNIYYKGMRNGYVSLKSLFRLSERGIRVKKIVSEKDWKLLKKVLKICT